MQWVIIFFVAMYLICTCHNEEQTTKEAKAAEEARIEREVERRVEIESKKLADRDALLHTVTLTGFLVLAGGIVIRFLWVRRSRFTASVIPTDRGHRITQVHRASSIEQPRPRWNAYQAPRVGRVIDLKPVNPSPPAQQPAQKQPGRTRNRHQRRWNQDPDWQPNPPRGHRKTPPRS